MKYPAYKSFFIQVGSVIFLFFIAGLIVNVVSGGMEAPIGNETYGHLYKVEQLYSAFISGQDYLNYGTNWYNGMQPFELAGILPYCMLVGLRGLTYSIEVSYKIFIMLMMALGGGGFIAWGRYIKRPFLGLVIGMLWIVIPSNMNLLLGEGNITMAFITSLLPYIFLYFQRSIWEQRKRDLVCLALYMMMVMLSDVLIAIIIVLTLGVYGLVYAVSHKIYKVTGKALGVAVLGIMSMGFLLSPILQSELFKKYVYALMIQEVEVYYLGIGFSLAIMIGCLFTYKQSRIPYVAIIFILGIMTGVVVIGESEWIKRLLPLVMCLVFIGILNWKSLRKILVVGILGVIFAESVTSYNLKGASINKLDNHLQDTINQAVQVASQNIVFLGSNYKGIYLDYLIGYNDFGKELGQVMELGWHKSSIAPNIEMLNRSLEEGYYGVMFDRALELGADTVIISVKQMNDLDELELWAQKAGYNSIGGNEYYKIYKYPVESAFGTRVLYKGLLIGNKSDNLEYIFPTFIRGRSEYIDDYSVDELSQYEAIFLAGFKYHKIEQAQRLLEEVARLGTRVVIDTVGKDTSLFNLRLQPIVIKESFSNIYYKGRSLGSSTISEEFKTNFITQEVKNEDHNYAIIGSQKLNYIQEHEENLYTLALNLPYYAYLTKDIEVLKLLEDLFKLKAYELPDRTIELIKIETNKNKVSIEAREKDVIIPVGYSHNMNILKGSFVETNNLIQLQSNIGELEIEFPYGVRAWIISGIGLVAMVFLIFSKRRKKNIYE